MARGTWPSGQVDISLEASLMATYMAMPQEGHLQMLYRMFGCLKLHPKQKLAFDPAHLIANEKRFMECTIPLRIIDVGKQWRQRRLRLRT
jgi:hypothetical protein